MNSSLLPYHLPYQPTMCHLPSAIYLASSPNLLTATLPNPQTLDASVGRILPPSTHPTLQTATSTNQTVNASVCRSVLSPTLEISILH